MGIIFGYAGTYAASDGGGMYRFSFDTDTGVLGEPEVCLDAPDCKYLALRDGILAAPVRRGEHAGIILADISAEGPVRSAEVLTERDVSCFTAFDENCIYTANYHEGTVSVYWYEGTSAQLIQRVSVAAEAGCHQVLFDKHTILVPCLEIDTVMIFDRGGDFSLSGEIPFPPGSGPRHGIFDRSRRRLYLVCERSNQLFTFNAQRNGRYIVDQIQNIPLREKAESSDAGTGQKESDTSAAIRMSPDGRFLYVSVRGADTIAVFRIQAGRPECIQVRSAEGNHPRDCLLSPDGRFLLAANRFSDSVVSMERDAGNGKLGTVCSQVRIPQAVSLAFEGWKNTFRYTVPRCDPDSI